MPVGSLLEVVVPAGSSVEPGQVECAIAGYEDSDGLQCSALADRRTLQFPVQNELRRFEQNVFFFDGVFNAPKTSESTASFELRIFNSDKSETLVESLIGNTLTLLEPNELKSVTIS